MYVWNNAGEGNTGTRMRTNLCSVHVSKALLDVIWFLSKSLLTYFWTNLRNYYQISIFAENTNAHAKALMFCSRFCLSLCFAACRFLEKYVLTYGLSIHLNYIGLWSCNFLLSAQLNKRYCFVTTNKTCSVNIWFYNKAILFLHLFSAMLNTLAKFID